MAKKILVVDDEEELRNMIARFLKRKGYETFEAGSGNKALEFLKSNSVDAIVSDVRMSDGDGLFLLKTIQAELNPAPPLVFISGFADADMDELQNLGAAGIEGKPLDKASLLSKIEKLTS